MPIELMFPSYPHEINLSWLYHKHTNPHSKFVSFFSFSILCFSSHWSTHGSIHFFIFKLLQLSTVTMINQQLKSFFEYPMMLRFLYFSIIWSIVTDDSAFSIIAEILLSSLLLRLVNFQQVVITLPFHRVGKAEYGVNSSLSSSK